MSENKIIQGKFYTTKTIGEGKSGKIFEVLVLKDIIYANKGDKLAIKEYKAWVLEEQFQAIIPLIPTGINVYLLFGDLSVNESVPHVQSNFSARVVA